MKSKHLCYAPPPPPPPFLNFAFHQLSDYSGAGAGTGAEFDCSPIYEYFYAELRLLGLQKALLHIEQTHAFSTVCILQ